MRINGTSPTFSGAKDVKAITRALKEQSPMQFFDSVGIGAFEGITRNELASDIVQISKEKAIKENCIIPGEEKDIMDGFKLLLERISDKQI